MENPGSSVMIHELVCACVCVCVSGGRGVRSKFNFVYVSLRKKYLFRENVWCVGCSFVSI